VIELNKKVLGVALALIVMALLATPVMAAPATKIEGVTLTIAATTVPDPGYPRMVSHDTISHTKGTSTGTVTLTIPILEPDGLDGDWDAEWVARGKFSQDPAELIITSKAVLTFTGGTFEGVTQRKIIGWPVPSYFEDHMVLQGTGDFEGQTLKLSYEGGPPPVAEGCLIIPK
jgi:hypothetical protein